jgi:hypothetical protein
LWWPSIKDHLRFHSKRHNLQRWPTDGNHLALWKFSCTATGADVRFRVQREAV